MSPATTLRPTFLFLCLLSLLSFFSFANSDELQLLLTIKSALKDSHTGLFDSWESNKPVCEFQGVTCNEENLVREIDLSNQHLSGKFPFDSVCKLESLEKLSLGANYLVGPVTEDLNNCTELRYLDLGNNNFSNTVPDISSLTKLTTLYLNKSEFQGKFPWNSLENMSNLSILSLGDNEFDKSPFPEQVLKLKKLTWLYLTGCSIEGKIPAGIGNLTELEDLELSDNYLSGEIPYEISYLRNLWQLELYSNQLTGKIPTGFRNLTKLKNFDASTNFLEGDLSEFGFMSQMESIQLFENNLSGEMPPEFGDFKNLRFLSLYTNKFTGTVPQSLGSWADFLYIDISENSFSGFIPPNMCKKGKMEELLILQNKFVGEIPESYANCTTLTRFRVSNNSLSGNVPSGLWGLPKVNIIDLAMNNFDGTVSSKLGDAESLSELNLANNKFSGELPVEISQVSTLVKLDTSYNQFSGKIPDSIGRLKELTSLHLQVNMFSGTIPSSLATCSSLTDINIAGNLFSGDIPAKLGDLPTLNSLNMSMNQLSGSIPSSLSSLRLSLLDLSNNRLSGLIPQSLSIEAYNGSFAGNEGLCSQNIKFFRRCSSKSRVSSETRTLIACFVVGLAVLLVSLACYLNLRKSVKDIQERSLKEDSWDVKSFHVLTFTEDEILDSVKQENLIGKGGSGNVYRVLLPNGIELAVKHIWHSDSNVRKKIRTTSPMLSNAKKSPEFDAEVQTLSSIRHVNVVKLYCSITSEDSSLLVYEYMPNGSLWDRLHTSEKMVIDWTTRYEIALGAAKGLEYLHHNCEKPVLHRDVKSSNILLDEFMKPRIADFGLAKIVQANATNNTTHVIAGTHGYIAPEYGYTYKVSEKSDVYSFGVVLMELVSGKRPIEPEYGDNKDIVSWVCSKLKTKETVLSVVDSRIREAYQEEAIKVLKIAILCTARQPALRPTMRTVVQMLEDADPNRLIGIVVRKDGSKKEDPVKNIEKP
ncbi:hypothetical protein ACET3Z_009724 [Daucus carota]